MATIAEVLNVAIPLLLLAIAMGFIWTKFIDPWVMPMMKKFWEWLTIQNTPSNQPKGKEINYE